MVTAAALGPHGLEGVGDLVDDVGQQAGEGEEAEGVEEAQLFGGQRLVGHGTSRGVGDEGRGAQEYDNRRSPASGGGLRDPACDGGSAGLHSGSALPNLVCRLQPGAHPCT